MSLLNFKNKALLDKEFRSRELTKILNDFKNNLIDSKANNCVD